MNQKPFAEVSRDVLEYINTSRPVDCYRNLHKNCISVKQGGVVVCHAQNVVLKDATFIVSEKGRDKVREKKQKGVHAFIRGYVKDATETREQLDYDWSEVTYNPYTCNFFKCCETDRYVDRAEWVDLAIDSMGSDIRAFNLMYKVTRELSVA